MAQYGTVKCNKHGALLIISNHVLEESDTATMNNVSTKKMK